MRLQRALLPGLDPSRLRRILASRGRYLPLLGHLAPGLGIRRRGPTGLRPHAHSGSCAGYRDPLTTAKSTSVSERCSVLSERSI
jgi:hypothetical protein